MCEPIKRLFDIYFVVDAHEEVYIASWPKDLDWYLEGMTAFTDLNIYGHHPDKPGLYKGKIDFWYQGQHYVVSEPVDADAQVYINEYEAISLVPEVQG